MDTKSLWQACAAFHGHQCGGLTIGFKAALYAVELLGLTPPQVGEGRCISQDEEIVCVTENDACGVDAIQVLLGCTAGKGNLIFRLRGKQAYTFYRRDTGRGVRLVLRPLPAGMTRAESFVHLQAMAPRDMFDVTEAALPLPERARLFESVTCPLCGESTGLPWTVERDGQLVCLDCLDAQRA